MIKQRFLEAALQSEALKFGSFTLKSGRTSPYFFNLGRFNTGAMLSELATAYATTLIESKLEFDVVFGPAYKGIPLAALTAAKLAELESEMGKTAYAFNRKEAKDHGEGGNIVGCDLKGKRIVIVDDVITAGTAIREAAEIIEKAGGRVAGIVIALDRQERTEASSSSAVGLVAKELGVTVLHIVGLDDIVEFLGPKLDEKELEAIKEYQSKWAA